MLASIREVEQEKQMEYLNKSPKWRLDSQQLEKLNTSITMEEIQEAWKKTEKWEIHWTRRITS